MRQHTQPSLPDQPKSLPVNVGVRLKPLVLGAHRQRQLPEYTLRDRRTRVGFERGRYLAYAPSGTRGSPEKGDVNTYIGRWFSQHLAR